MNITNDRFDGSTAYSDNYSGPKSNSGVSWPAILAGAVTAVTVSIALLVFGSGLGLAIMSPFSSSGDTTAVEFGVSAAIWMVIMQWLSSALAGYMSGRLRNKWSDIQQDEVFFRDTAHGFLAWAVATVFTVAFMASAAASVISGGAKAAGAVATGVAAGAANAASDAATGPGNPMDYYVDMMFRSDKPVTGGSEREIRMEATRIFVRDMAKAEFPAEDRDYLARALATRNGVSQADAARKVDQAIAAANQAKEEVKQAADDTRKAAASASIYTFLSMLIGAFIACVTGVIGGRHRDEI